MGRKLTFDTLTSYLDYLSYSYSDHRDEMLLVDDLSRFGICDMEDLFVLMGKHSERLSDEQKELNALT